MNDAGVYDDADDIVACVSLPPLVSWKSKVLQQPIKRALFLESVYLVSSKTEDEQ